MRGGYPHPDFLLSQLSQRQWREWVAFNEVSPFTTRAWEFRLGHITAWMVSVLCAALGKAFKKVPVSLDIFPETFWKRPEPKTPEQIERQKKAIAESHKIFFEAMVAAGAARKVEKNAD